MTIECGDGIWEELETHNELKSNWEDSIVAILSQTPDPRLTNE